MRTIHYDLGVEDYAAFADRVNSDAIPRTMQRLSPSRSNGWIIAAIVLVEFVGAAYFFWISRPISGSVLVVAAAYTIYIWNRWKRRTSPTSLRAKLDDLMRRQFDAGELRIPLGRQSLTLSADGFQYAREGVESRYEWRAIDRVESCADHIFIFDQSHGAIIVPRRAFSTIQDALDFEGEIAASLQESRELHPPVLRGATREFVQMDARKTAAKPTGPGVVSTSSA